MERWLAFPKAFEGGFTKMVRHTRAWLAEANWLYSGDLATTPAPHHTPGRGEEVGVVGLVSTTADVSVELFRGEGLFVAANCRDLRF